MGQRVQAAAGVSPTSHARPTRACQWLDLSRRNCSSCVRSRSSGWIITLHARETYSEEGSVNLHDPHLVQRKWIAFYLKPGAGQVFYGVRYDLARPVWRICLVLHANWT